MNTQLETRLIECLSALDHGESIESAIARYPEDAVMLQPMLETAAALPTLRLEPSESARQASRRTFLNQAHAMSQTSRRRAGGWPVRLAALSLALVLIFLTGGAVVASASALPGDALYGVKRIVENVRLSFASDPAAQEALTAQFEQERRNETAALLANNREAEVTFAGTIEAIGPDVWVVDGIQVQIAETTRIAGAPRPGMRAVVTGGTINGSLFASSIALEPGSAPLLQPTATPTPSSTARPTNTALPTSTTQPTSTPSATPPPTVVPATIPPTAVRRPTAPPPPPPSNTPAPRVDDNGNSNDNNANGNDDSGNDNANGNDDSGNDDNANNNDDNGNDDSSGSGGGNDDNSNDDSGGGGGNDGNENDDNSGSGGSGNDDGGGGNDDSGGGGGNDDGGGGRDD